MDPDYFYKWETENRPNPDYLNIQKEIGPKHRRVVVEWLFEVKMRLFSTSKSYFLTIALFDQFLSLRSCPRDKLQTVGSTCLLIASKLVDHYNVGAADLAYMQCAGSTKLILSCENLILNALQENLNLPTCMDFLTLSPCSDEMTQNIALYLLYLSVLNEDILNYLPSVVAASALSLAHNITRDKQTSECQCTDKRHRYAEQDLQACKEVLQECLKSYNSKNQPYPTIYENIKLKHDNLTEICTEFIERELKDG